MATFENGYQTFLDGGHLIENPHHHDHQSEYDVELARKWAAGWRQARDDNTLAPPTAKANNLSV